MNNTNLLPQEIGHLHRYHPQDEEPVLIMSESGMPILETMSGVTMPADYSFECVNNFVHCENPGYEDLQNLALGMSSYIGQLEAQIAAQPNAAQSIHYPSCWDTAAYPTLESALAEIGAFKCGECAPDAAPVHPSCGACPGDGSICKSSCRVVDESPPAQPSDPMDWKLSTLVLRMKVLYDMAKNKQPDQIEARVMSDEQIMSIADEVNTPVRLTNMRSPWLEEIMLRFARRIIAKQVDAKDAK